jgi:Protein of unknown function (DUF4235)
MIMPPGQADPLAQVTERRLMTDKRADIGTRIIGGLAAMAAAFVMRKFITAVWTKTTGKEPPAHPEDPQVALSEALGWAVLTGVGVEAARLLATRAAVKRTHHDPVALSTSAAPLCRALPADKLAVALFGKLAPVVHEEAAGAGELICLPRHHPDRELLVRQVSPRQFKAFSHIVGVKVNRARRLVHPPCLQFLQAVLSKVVVCLARAVVIGCHRPSPFIRDAQLLRGCNAFGALVVPDSGGEFCHVRARRTRGSPILPHASRSGSSTARNSASRGYRSGPAATVMDVLSGPESPPTTAPASRAMMPPAA